MTIENAQKQYRAVSTSWNFLARSTESADVLARKMQTVTLKLALIVADFPHGLLMMKALCGLANYIEIVRCRTDISEEEKRQILKAYAAKRAKDAARRRK